MEDISDGMLIPSDSALLGEVGVGAPPDVVVEKATSGESGMS